ncbi:MAG: hypothetical protein IT542_10815 [Rubellimicrobium sp.]|nr:hypothetical protein [Rubellimicrobium sp.]
MLLEHFDIAAPAPGDGPGEEWLAGYRTGLDEGRAAAEAAQADRSLAMAQILADLDFTFREAQAQVMARLEPLFRILADQVVPSLLQQTLGVAVVAEILDAARRDAGGPLEIGLSPADHDAVATALTLLPAARVSLREDGRLGPGQVMLRGGAGTTSLDLARLGREVTSALDALASDMKGKEANG